jgi:hypothetical protein
MNKIFCLTLYFLLLPSLHAKNFTALSRVKMLQESRVDYISNCHGTVLFALGAREYPLFAASIGSYLEKNCSTKKTSYQHIPVIQVLEHVENGAMPVHSFIEFGVKTFSKDGPDLIQARFSTVDLELAPYQVEESCQNLSESKAFKQGCIRFTIRHYCPDTSTSTKFNEVASIDELRSRLDKIYNLNDTRYRDEIEDIRETINWSDFWLQR